MKKYWTNIVNRMPEGACEDDEAYPVYIVGDDNGPICEFTDENGFLEWCAYHKIDRNGKPLPVEFYVQKAYDIAVKAANGETDADEALEDITGILGEILCN